MATVEDVTDALRDVIDPELGLDFVELGLIYDVEIDGGTVRVTYTLTSPGCPIGPQVSEQIEEFVGELDGVEDVQSTRTFSPPWTPELMSADAKFALGAKILDRLILAGSPANGYRCSRRGRIDTAQRDGGQA